MIVAMDILCRIWHLVSVFLKTALQLSTLIENWYKGYEEVMPLDSKDKEMAKTFMLARQIQLLAWVTSHSKSTYVQGIDKDFSIKMFY